MGVVDEVDEALALLERLLWFQLYSFQLQNQAAEPLDVFRRGHRQSDFHAKGS